MAHSSTTYVQTGLVRHSPKLNTVAEPDNLMHNDNHYASCYNHCKKATQIANIYLTINAFTYVHGQHKTILQRLHSEIA